MAVAEPVQDEPVWSHVLITAIALQQSPQRCGSENPLYRNITWGAY